MIKPILLTTQLTIGYVWLIAHSAVTLDVWRSSSTEYGAPFVTMVGVAMMQEFSAGNYNNILMWLKYNYEANFHNY